jgi:CheY-like chemotaxis protein
MTMRSYSSLTRCSFANAGFEIRTASNGADALAEYCAWHPVAVILDIEMPRLDGRAVAREIRYVRAIPAPLLVAVTGLGAILFT